MIASRFVSRALAGAVVACLLPLTACSSVGSSCAELEAWYDENPGDSNVDIAKDYLRQCDDTPPPVLSGELTMEDLQ